MWVDAGCPAGKRPFNSFPEWATGSPTWFLDSCGATTSPKRRLLLTNYELGAEVYGPKAVSEHLTRRNSRVAPSGMECVSVRLVSGTCAAVGSLHVTRLSLVSTP
jgi:hypothetical protein